MAKSRARGKKKAEPQETPKPKPQEEGNGDAAKPVELVGGFGGPDSLNPDSYRDTRLVERALRQRWPVPKEVRQALIDRQIAIATNPKSAPREATIAFKAILAAESQNQADELQDAKLKQEDRHHEEGETVYVHGPEQQRNRLAAISKRLGTRIVSGPASAVETKPGNGSVNGSNGKGHGAQGGA